MGRGGGVPPSRPPSQAAYYVALAGVALLLLMLCCYFLYFCIKKINELSEHESLCGAPASRAQPTPARTEAYPVQPVVRDSATAMAKLCKELPSSGGRSTVFPAASSPAALLADTGVRGGSLTSGEGATLSEDTATTGTSLESPPPAIAPMPDR
ncbi:uncharacterized protein LOC125242250 [Leguminivora glycinivorella]|uniref:uncharacterized protein LOC125242250 n=1 Tax=Leguminivora glycinivorella TaxID=1035111 RepID=UPI00201038FD|nr:uncharacterized protein LOC125242250 [Leguminivora glycinivorella]